MSGTADGAGRRPRRYIDWRQAARLIAAGQTPAAAAAALGISEDRLWRHFETSDHFRNLVRQAGQSRHVLGLALQIARTGSGDAGR